MFIDRNNTPTHSGSGSRHTTLKEACPPLQRLQPMEVIVLTYCPLPTAHWRGRLRGKVWVGDAGRRKHRQGLLIEHRVDGMTRRGLHLLRILHRELVVN